MEYKAIETFYDGYRFRSRLEARWAYVFKTLGISYQYESEWFQMSTGHQYCPDFKVIMPNAVKPYTKKDYFWIEIKGSKFMGMDKAKVEAFSKEYAKETYVLVLIGNLPNGTKIERYVYIYGDLFKHDFIHSPFPNDLTKACGGFEKIHIAFAKAMYYKFKE